jgi:rubrerythrin
MKREWSREELSVLCSNLGKACGKQLREEEAKLFDQLASYYQSQGTHDEGKQLSDLGHLIQEDLNLNYPEVKKAAILEKDRGALRAITWGEKVTRILNSLLNRYEKQKDEILKNTNVFVCEICGFSYVGDEAPAICPICKVPKSKIIKIERKVM